MTDAASRQTTYAYNNMDRLVSRTDPLMHAETYQYDNNGNLTQVTDRKSQVTTFTHDGLNRRTVTTYAGPSTVTATHDAGNRVTQLADSAAGTITRSYDGLDRLTQETTPQGAVSYSYDAASRRATMTVSSQPAVSYTYDNADRLTQVVQGSQTVGLTYDNTNRRSTLTLPNGIILTYSYDSASRLTGLTYSLGQTTLGTLAYTSDPVGNRAAIGGSWARTNLPAVVATASYNANHQQLAFGGATMTYDLNGNLATLTDAGGATTYSWNARNQLTGLAGPGVSASFGYDALGRRRTKTVNAAQTDVLYDSLNPVQEGLLPATPSANLLTGLGLDELLTRTDAAGLQAFLTDALGSSIALADGTGNIQTEYTYAPFGETTSTGQTNTNPFKFTGREDDGTGLYYYRARYYHPGLGRFVSEDPVGLATGEFNLYAYARNRPTLLRDPLGLWTFGLGVELQGGLMGHGAGVGVSLVIDGHGNVGVQVTVGGGGWGGPLGGSIGVEGTGTSAGTIHDLTGPGGAGQISIPGIAPTFGGVAGSGYGGGTVGVAGTAGIGVGSGFVTYTTCVLGCRKSTPPPELPPLVAP